MADYNWEKNTLKTIEKHFNNLGVAFEYIDINMGNEIVKPAIYSSLKLKDIDFDIYISAQDVHNVQWIVLRCIVCDLNDLDLKDVNEIFKLALTVNYYIPETTFSSANDFLYLENDMPLDVDAENFNFEITGLELGISIFIKQMEAKGYSITSTKGILKK
jgi:hypothetical protein